MVALPWDWDPFRTMDRLTWINSCFFLLILTAFSFTSIVVPHTCPVHGAAGFIRLRIGNFSLPMTLSLMASLIFPQTLFWFIYLILIFAPFWPAWVAHFLERIRGMASTIPVYEINISATRPPQLSAMVANEPDSQQEEPAGSEVGDSEANSYVGLQWDVVNEV